jgi:hypothetical protein
VWAVNLSFSLSWDGDWDYEWAGPGTWTTLVERRSDYWDNRGGGVIEPRDERCMIGVTREGLGQVGWDCQGVRVGRGLEPS